MKREFSIHIFEKSSNMKFNENPFIGSLVPCGRTDGRTHTHTHTHTHTTKLIVAFRNIASTPQNTYFISAGTSCVIVDLRHLVMFGPGIDGSRV